MPSNRSITNLAGQGNMVSAVGKGPWVRNNYTLAFAHLHLRVTGAGSATVVIEGSLDPGNGDAGAVPLFVSDPAMTWTQAGTSQVAATRAGTLTADDTGDGGQLQGTCAWVRYNVTAISGTAAALTINLSGDVL